MVRLEELLQLSWAKGNDLFQFQNGTIRSLENSIVKLSISLFQFQNGTIRSFKVKYCILTLGKFQFQNGTIRSPFSYLFTRLPIHFNSKMVRLEDSNRYWNGG